MTRSTYFLASLLVLGACTQPNRPVLVREDGSVAAYPADFRACKAEADRLYDPDNPELAPSRYHSIGLCLMAHGYTYEPRIR